MTGLLFRVDGCHQRPLGSCDAVNILSCLLVAQPLFPVHLKLKIEPARLSVQVLPLPCVASGWRSANIACVLTRLAHVLYAHTCASLSKPSFVKFDEYCCEKTNGCFGKSVIIKGWLDSVGFAVLTHEI